MANITILIASATTLFGLVVTLAITVVGFFKAREWFVDKYDERSWSRYDKIHGTTDGNG